MPSNERRIWIDGNGRRGSSPQPDSLFDLTQPSRNLGGMPRAACLIKAESIEGIFHNEIVWAAEAAALSPCCILPIWVEGACLSVQHTPFLLIAPTGAWGTSSPSLDSSKCWAAKNSEPSPALAPLVSRPKCLVQMGKLKPEKGKRSGYTASSPSSLSLTQPSGVNQGGSDLCGEKKRVEEIMKLMTTRGTSGFTPDLLWWLSW